MGFQHEVGFLPWMLVVFFPHDRRRSPKKNPAVTAVVSPRSRLIQPEGSDFCEVLVEEYVESTKFPPKNEGFAPTNAPSQERGYSSWKALCFSVWVVFFLRGVGSWSRIPNPLCWFFFFFHPCAPGSAEESQDDFFAGFRVALGSEKPQEKIGHAACWCQIILKIDFAEFSRLQMCPVLYFSGNSPP